MTLLRILLCGTLFCFFGDLVAQSTNRNEKYIEQYKDLAISEMERTGIPASIKLAQGILESGAGTSRLSRRANNHFGIKCHSNWTGDTFYLKDDDYNEHGELVESCFRAYDRADDSWRAHSEFIRDPRKHYRYGFLFELDPQDYKAWARGLKRAGYATSPTYANKLIEIIERHQLYEYDRMTNGNTGGPITGIDVPITGGHPTTPSNPPGTNGGGTVIIDGGHTPTVPGTYPPAPTQPNGIPGQVYTFNDVRYTLAGNRERVSDIAKRHQLTSNEVIRYNRELTESDQIVPAGSTVFLQPKRAGYRGDEQYHKVLPGQTMAEISDKYAISLTKLYHRNRLTPPQQPVTGAQVKLRGWKVKKAPEHTEKPVEIPSTTTPDVLKDTISWPTTLPRPTVPSTGSYDPGNHPTIPGQPTRPGQPTTNPGNGPYAPNRPGTGGPYTPPSRPGYPTTNTGGSTYTPPGRPGSPSGRPTYQPGSVDEDVFTGEIITQNPARPASTDDPFAPPQPDTGSGNYPPAPSPVGPPDNPTKPTTVPPAPTVPSPDTTPAPGASTNEPPSTTTESTETYAVYHTVRKGETLYSLARRYSTSVDNIMRINNLPSTTIRPGQQLRME